MEVAEPAREAARVLKSKTEEALLIVFVCEIQNHTDLYFIFIFCFSLFCDVKSYKGFEGFRCEFFTKLPFKITLIPTVPLTPLPPESFDLDGSN
jgi:hypothetical protein